jgi:superfamily II DNA or RNA helicase
LNAHHNKAAYWVSKGVFDGLKSFTEFECRVNDIPEEKDRGDVFEIFIEGYLATQAITQHTKHWVVGGIPVEMRERFNLPNDGTGIDGIYEERGGNQVAYQVKYRKNHNLTFAEVAPFLGITEKFTDRVIFTNASSLSDKAAARTRWYSGEVFNALTSVEFDQIEAWLKEKPAPLVKAAPDPSYQTQVLDDIAATLKDHDRASVVMACGTGKTLVALWATEQAQPKTVLVLLPSLMLLKQTLREWSQHTSWGSKFSYLCVCSDKTVGLRGDSINIDKSDVGFKVDTDPELVREFLERKTGNIKVIFSTYQSTEVVARGAAGLPPIDLAIFDEAHKTTGRAGGMFSYALDDEKIRIEKRLFLTATPRHINIRKRDKDGNFRVQSMDDETQYGPRAHTLSFGAAANKGIICRYKVIISLIDKQMVDDFSRNNGITLVEGDEIAARWVANLLALEQAVERVGASKIITFHSRVSNAQEFAKNEPRGIAHYLDGYDVRHVNGKQNSAARSDAILAFASAPQGVITNARCLSEGVDIPAVDMVAFVDPRQSKVDIVQSVGRAMRKPRHRTKKTVGYVLVPLFAGMDGDSLEEAIKSERFDAIADVLNALQEHDEDLIDIIRELKQRKGEDKPFRPKRLLDKIEFIGPEVGFDKLVNSIAVEITGRLGVPWDGMYGCLVRFKEREGHCLVTRGHEEDGFEGRLGSWVMKQRAKKDKLSPEQIERLDALGFVWDPHTYQWEEAFAALVRFKEREGHCLVTRGHEEDGFEGRLGSWVMKQRAKKDKLSPEQIERLDALGFVWDPHTYQWEEAFAALVRFKEREGHCLVTRGHEEDGFEGRLGSWVMKQRAKKDKLSSEQIERLDALGFVWDPIAQQWEDAFAALVRFKEREGHCLVTRGHEEDGFEGRLDLWVSNQRAKKDKLSSEQIERLDALGFVWDPIAQQWEDAFAALVRFKEREGHCLVTRGHEEDGFEGRLDLWSQKQRAKKDKLSSEQIERLDALGFVWEPIAQQWEDAFAALVRFKEREGHCLVTRGHEEDGLEGRLGSWVMKQRAKKDKLSSEQIERLDALGFVWDPIAQQWEDAFAALVRFKEREGHCLVTRGHEEDGFEGRLDLWSQKQRAKKDKLSSEQIERLDALGFVWDPIAQQWEDAFAALVRFKEREGHCLVTRGHEEDGFEGRLGSWVMKQRAKKDKLSPEQIERLDALGFVWDPHTYQWEEAFAALVRFKEREGHCLVTRGHEEDGFEGRLGSWVMKQRAKKDKLFSEQIERLDALGFVWRV